MKKIILSYAAIIMSVSVFAQTKADSTLTPTDTIKPTAKHWKRGGIAALNSSQSSFTNWAAGGENSISATALLNLFVNYKTEKTNWDNVVDLAYGMLQSGKAPLRKNEDKIDFTSKYGRYAFYNHWYYSALINFKSQFTDGYNFPNDSVRISHFMAPGYVLGSIGLDYKSKDNGFSLFTSPMTSKTTVVNDQRLADEGAYGVIPATYDTISGASGISVNVKHGKNIRSEFGGYLKVTFKKDIVKNVNLSTKLELFSNYLDAPQNIDVNWEILIGMKVNKYISASIST